jgi:uncharacterized RDD family membrane protein YckC
MASEWEVSDRSSEPSIPPAPVATSGAPLGAGAALAHDLTAFPRASFRDRAAAAILDLIVVLVGVQLLAPILAPFRDDNLRTFALVMLAYHIWFWTAKATTVGGIICQLRVVRLDGAPLQFSDTLVRALSGLFSFAVLGLGFFWIIKDSERQAWHDKIAGTYVVKVPRNYPV